MLHFIIGHLLLMMSAVSLLSSVIYAEAGMELWWSRLALALILLGLWYAGSERDR